jgi:hypothetical protein
MFFKDWNALRLAQGDKKMSIVRQIYDCETGDVKRFGVYF